MLICDFNVFNFSEMMFDMLPVTANYIVYPLFGERGALLYITSSNFILILATIAITTLQIIDTVRKHVLTGGSKRLPFTIPPLVFSSLKVWLAILIVACLYCSQLYLVCCLHHDELIMLAAIAYVGDYINLSF